MDKLVIEGGAPLSGEIAVHGAKNSSLPLLAATILCGGESVIHNCPNLTDVEAAVRILSYLGCKVTQSGDSVAVNSHELSRYDVPEDLMGEMRSSIMFLGAIIARAQKACISFPGGCEIGQRPINLHLSALRQMGVEITEEHGFVNCSVRGRLKGAKISLSFPSVGATENAMLAAVLADGETVITNAAQEPEIMDLGLYLNKCGANISGAGESTIFISGVDKLHGVHHHVIPDRIVATTYLCAAAVTGGELLLTKVRPSHIESVITVLREMGCALTVQDDNIYIRSGPQLNAVNIRTMPYPGFPTDAQALFMAATTLAKGASMFVETIFDNRYKHVGELMRMGANIKVEGSVAVVEGVNSLHGATVRATDLRGGAALVVAGLAAKNRTQILELKHIDRGYERIVDDLRTAGANIIRVSG